MAVAIGPSWSLDALDQWRKDERPGRRKKSFKDTRARDRPTTPQLQQMFQGEKMEDLTPDQQYAVTEEDGDGQEKRPG